MFFYRLNLTESCFPKNQNLGIPLDSTSQSPCSTGPCATRRVCTRGSQKGSSQTHSEGGGAPFFRRELAVSQLSGVSCRCGGNWGKTNQIFLSEMDLCWWLTMIVGFSRKVFFFFVRFETLRRQHDACIIQDVATRYDISKLWFGISWKSKWIFWGFWRS